MPIVSVLNPKGGSGKTTLTTQLARSLQLVGFSVLLVDSDPQGSARDWHAVNEDNPVPLIALDRAGGFKTLPGIAAGYDFTLIDGAAKLETIIAAAIKVSDAILIPVQPSPYDIWAAGDLVELIQTRQQVTEGHPKAAFIISRAISGTRLERDVSEALKEYDFPALKTPVIQRQVYPQTAATGKTVFDADNPAAIAEINQLTLDLLDLLNLTKMEKIA